MIMKKVFLLATFFISGMSFAQIYTPGGITNATQGTNVNVGIGTSTPKSKFEIFDVLNMKLSFGVIPTGSASNEPTILFSRWSGNPANTYISNSIHTLLSPTGTNGNNFGLAFSTISLHANNDFSGAMVRMFISNYNGYVGIGSINPDEKLTVKGKIHAEEVRVDLAVPADYVFEKYYTGKSSLKSDYVMPTLADIEKFTKENNHLPNVPSAQEIKDKGLQLGEMNNILLQKIEELTLYIIEQNKRIEVLEAKVDAK